MVVAQTKARCVAQLLVFCLMRQPLPPGAAHPQSQLSRLMRHLNGVHTRGFDRCHSLSDHLFQGRIQAVLVDRVAYLMPLCRCVERNPVAAGLVAKPAERVWSSWTGHTLGWSHPRVVEHRRHACPRARQSRGKQPRPISERCWNIAPRRTALPHKTPAFGLKRLNSRST